MRKILLALTTVVLFIILLIAITAFVFKPDNIVNDNVDNTSAIINVSTETFMAANITNFTGYIPSNEKVENAINWSKYPAVGYHFIHEKRVAGPNNVINHTFLLVSMRIEIKNPNDTLEVYRQLSSIVKEARTLLGPNSAFELKGEVDGIVAFFAGILPYSTEVYREDHYHPVSNMTWSDIDISEIN